MTSRILASIVFAAAAAASVTFGVVGNASALGAGENPPNNTGGLTDACWSTNINLGAPQSNGSPPGIGPNTCPEGQEDVAGLCYQSCPAGFTSWDGASVTAVCYATSGSSATWDRTEVLGHPTCATGRVYISGLCFEAAGPNGQACPEGFSQENTLCVQDCPSSFPVRCGAACAASSSACEQLVADQVGGVLLSVVGGVAAVAGGEEGVTLIAEGSEYATEGFDLTVCPITR